MMSYRFRKWVAWFLTGGIVVVGLYTIATGIPYAYAGYGIVLFAVGGGMIWCLMKGRKRIALTAILAVLCLSLVVVLRVVARQTLTVVNETDVHVAHLSILFPATNHLLTIPGIPPHGGITVTFHSIVSSPDIVVLGQFENGTQISWQDLPAFRERPAIPPSGYRDKKVLIQSGGTVRVLVQ